MTTITIEVPDRVVPRSPGEAEELSRELRIAAALRWLDRGRISRDEAAEIAGLKPDQIDRIIEQGLAGERPHPDAEAGQAGASSDRPFDPEEAEDHYLALGAWKGPLAAKDVQAAARAFWRGAGIAGARWLVGRLRDETDVEALHGVGAMLSDIPESSLGPILEGLRGDPPIDQALALLRALGWIGEGRQTDDPRAELATADFLFHEEADVREAACSALRVLPRGRAALWLSRQLRVEPDEEVRRAIEWELETWARDRG